MSEFGINWTLIKTALAQSIIHAAMIWGAIYWIYSKISKRKYNKAIKGLSGALVWLAASFGTLLNFMQGIQQPGALTFTSGATVAVITFFFLHFNVNNDDSA